MVMERMVSGCTLLIHISHFDRVGIFDESLRTTQDYDMWFRMLRGEVKLIHVPKALVVARIHEKQGSQTIKEFDEEREKLFLSFLKKLTLPEKIDLWGSEYTCLQHFQSFFKTYAMKSGYCYTTDELCKLEEPKDIVEKQKQAKMKLFQLTNIHTDARIAILGAGDYGRRVLDMLRSRGIDVDIFLDNNPGKWGSQIEGIFCTSVEDELCNKENTLVIMAAELFEQMQTQLLEKKFMHVTTKMHLEGILYNVPGKKNNINTYR